MGVLQNVNVAQLQLAVQALEQRTEVTSKQSVQTHCRRSSDDTLLGLKSDTQHTVMPSGNYLNSLYFSELNPIFG
jgi:hypothetical protein